MTNLDARNRLGEFYGTMEELRANWGWILALGMILIVLGVLALGSVVYMTLASVVFLGVLLMVGGVVQIVHAHSAKKWSGVFLYILGGILYLIIGMMVAANPGAGALALTLLLGVVFMVGGLFRIFSSLIVRYENWGWVLLSGVITLILGILIWRQWPSSALWVIGLFIGIDLIFYGWSWVILAFAAHGLKPRTTV